MLRPPALWLRLALVLSVLGPAWTTHAEEIRLPPPGSTSWRPLDLPRVERRTAYKPIEIDGVRGVRAESDCAASALVLPLEDVDLRRTPRLRWRWRLVRGLTLAEEQVKAADDFAARVYVMFPFEPEHASRWQRLRRRLAETVFGEQVPGSALNYVWSSREPAGAHWDNPFAPESKMISLGPAPTEAWREATVDLRSDYRALFGRDPPRPFGLALMTDSDNSCQQAVADYADFRLLPGEPAGGAAQGGGNPTGVPRIGGR